MKKRFENALAKHAAASDEIVSEVEKKLENLESEVKLDIDKFKQANVWLGAQNVVERVEGVKDVEPASREGEICTFLQQSKEYLVKARRQLDVLDDRSVGKEIAWGVDPKIVSEELRTWLEERKKAVGAEIDKGIKEATRLSCIWPDLERRDRYTYEKFLSFRTLQKFKCKGCEARAKLPYERACSD